MAIFTWRLQVRKSLEKAWRGGRFADKNTLDYYALETYAYCIDRNFSVASAVQPHFIYMVCSFYFTDGI